MMETNVSGMMGTTMDKIRGMVDANTIVGDPINTLDGTTIIPVSKVTYGFGSGGSDFNGKSEKQNFGGGAGAGVSIVPIAFIVVSNGETKIMPITTSTNTAEKAIALIPDIVDKIAGYIKDAVNSKNEKGPADDIIEE